MQGKASPPTKNRSVSPIAEFQNDQKVNRLVVLKSLLMCEVLLTDIYILTFLGVHLTHKIVSTSFF